ncbi:MAG: high-affinity branched-chain amino acid ABC transporter permease LivM [SAR324 cluster bacterium]|nr:high-affinity branched-chain amino acid ABC transporter permease LivM [SAR324 cluster bacterium]
MNYTRSLKDATVAALLGLVLFVPIMGLVLDGRSLVYRFPRVAVLVAAIFFGRMAVSLLAQTQVAAEFAEAMAPFEAVWRKIKGQYGNRAPLFLAGLAAALVIFPFLPASSNYLIQIFTLSLIYVMLGIGLNIVVGLAGLLDLGYVAFYAVGAYSYALLAHYFGFSFWASLPLAGGLAALAGCILGIPVLRMHGDYLAIVTLGFGEIIRILLTNMVWLTGGPNGMSAPRPTLFGLVFTAKPAAGETAFHQFLDIPFSSSHRYVFIYLIILSFVIASIWIFKRLREMPIGRAWEALREDEVASKALGINHTTTKLSAFTLGAAFGGLGGAFFATAEGFINPTSFTFIESAIILSIVVLGGMGTIVGVVLAAVLLTLMPELFREFENLRMLFFGMAMVFVMIWRPRGLLRVQRRQYEETGHAG